jgi:hypothetical protein
LYAAIAALVFTAVKYADSRPVHPERYVNPDRTRLAPDSGCLDADLFFENSTYAESFADLNWLCAAY